MGRCEAPEGVSAGGTTGPNHRDAAAALAGAQCEDGGTECGARSPAALAHARSGTGEESQCVWEIVTEWQVG